MADLQRLTPAQVSATRRSFLQGSSAAVIGGSLLAQLGTARQAHAAGSDVIKIGLVGCGGRGTGAQTTAGKKANRINDQIETHSSKWQNEAWQCVRESLVTGTTCDHSSSNPIAVRMC